MALGRTEYLNLDEKKVKDIRESMGAEDIIGPMAEKFKAFSDPNRIRILTALEKGELCVCDISYLMDLPQPTVSHHLKALRQLGIIQGRKSGKMTLYSIRDSRVLGLLAVARDYSRNNV